MTATTAKSGFVQGMIDGAPFLLVGVPFATLFGVVSEAAGLDTAQTVVMSALVIAGASQFTAVQLRSENAPVWLALLSAITVNLRVAMYSAALQPHLGPARLSHRVLAAYLNTDSAFALGLQRFEAEPAMPLSTRIAYFCGTMFPMGPLWVVFTWVGAVFGARLFAGLPLDFAMPILFLALSAPMLRSLAHVAAAITSIVAALALVWLPSGLGIVFAAMAAMAVGAEVERRRTP